MRLASIYFERKKQLATYSLSLSFGNTLTSSVQKSVVSSEEEENIVLSRLEVMDPLQLLRTDGRTDGRTYPIMSRQTDRKW